MPIPIANPTVGSAHIEGVESEFIVRTGHSCQGHPFTIEELRRILYEHIGEQVAGPQQQEAPPPDSAPPAAVPLPAATPESSAPGGDSTTERK